MSLPHVPLVGSNGRRTRDWRARTPEPPEPPNAERSVTGQGLDGDDDRNDHRALACPATDQAAECLAGHPVEVLMVAVSGGEGLFEGFGHLVASLVEPGLG